MLIGPYARFRVQYGTKIDDYLEQRERCLRALRMTCKAMRLRLFPWIWGHIEPSFGDHMGNLKVIVNASRADRSFASSVRYFCALLRSCGLRLIRSLYRFMTLHSLWNVAKFPLLVECLESLPNLHTLAIGSLDSYITGSIEDALKHCELPQIKALILPPSAHPLIKHCYNVEGVDCVVSNRPIPPNKFFGFLESIRGSNIKQLAIPLVSCYDASSKWSVTLWYHRVRWRLTVSTIEYVATCRGLTELTITYPHTYETPVSRTGALIDKVETARSMTLALVNVCKELPDFDTIQIVYFIPGAALMYFGEDCAVLPCSEGQKQALREWVKGVTDLAIDCLKKPGAGSREWEGRKTTVRVIELSLDYPMPHLAPPKVEVYEV